MTETAIAMAVAGAVFFAAEIVYDKFVRRESKLRRAIARHRRVPIEEATDGVVHVAGVVRPAGDVVRAPATGRSCVAFQLVVREPSRGVYVNVLIASDARPFVLTDDSGEAMVDLIGGPFRLIGDQRGTMWCTAEADTPEMQVLRELLDIATVPTTTLLGFAKRLRYREVVLLEGDDVSVVGRGERVVAVQGERLGYRDLPSRLVMRGAPDEPLIIGRHVVAE